MKNEIIVTMDESGELSSFARAQQFVLYRKTDVEWVKSDSLPAYQMTQGAEGIREIIKQLISRFADCRIILSMEISGIAYQVLNRHGYHIFESERVGDLDGIVLEIDSVKNEAQNKQSIPLEPYSKNDDGKYYLNLIELQQEHPEISSKKALRRFMEEQTFMELELICQHLPPWMEDAMVKYGLQYHIEPIGAHACRAVIYKGTCQ